MEIFGDAGAFWIGLVIIIVVYAIVDTIQNR
jgi:hypothetical protein